MTVSIRRSQHEEETMPTLDILRREPDIRSYRQGDTIYNVGEPGDSMYAVLDGSVEIRIGDKVIELVKPGEVFGEIGLIDAQPRSGTAIAAAECKVAVIGEKRFLRLVEQFPQFSLQIMRVVTDRLRRHGPH
jgi:CRP/FNR family transcriptional regulator, cyclic AMP receptor protein